MNRGNCPNSRTDELINNLNSYSYSPCHHDLLCNLKAQVFVKDQNKKNLTNLLSMYHNLEEEIMKISEEKKKYELDLNRLESDERNQIINDLKIKNENLFNELNERIDMNKKLYNENNKLFQELEIQAVQIENSHKQICSQEETIKRLKFSKEEIKNNINSLSQMKEKGESDLYELNIKVNKLNDQNKEQENILKNKNVQNYEIINDLNEEKNINKNLKIELKTKENILVSNQQKLSEENNNIYLMKSDIKNLENNVKKLNEDKYTINQNLLKENSILNKLNQDNQKLDNLINDRDECIKRINNDNEILKKDNKNLDHERLNLSKLFEAYKNHMSLLICQNKKLAGEIKYLLSMDNELRIILERDNHLKDIIYDNELFMNNSNEKIKEGIEVVFKNEEKNNSKIKRTYSIEGNNGINIINSPKMNKNFNNIEIINNLDERIINQENALKLSQGYHME